MFGSYALVGGTLAIDVAVVPEPPAAVVEQNLMADSARRRHNKYRASVNLVIAWRDWRCCVRPLGQIFSVHEQTKHEKGRDYNNRVPGTTGARADFWWTGEAAHSAKVRSDRLKVLLLHTATYN